LPSETGSLRASNAIPRFIKFLKNDKIIFTMVIISKVVVSLLHQTIQERTKT
jgi:hypothetical protein